MYSALLSSVLFADLIIKILITIGSVAGIVALVSLFKMVIILDNGEGNIKKYLKRFCICVSLSCISILVCNLNYFKPEFIVLRVAAPKIDAYILENPETIYNPETTLNLLNDTAISFVESMKEFPKLIRKYSTIESSSQTVEQEFEDFKKWKANQ
jgi:hypothetical protein